MAMSDGGSAFYAWRGVGAFTRLLDEALRPLGFAQQEHGGGLVDVSEIALSIGAEADGGKSFEKLSIRFHLASLLQFECSQDAVEVENRGDSAQMVDFGRQLLPGLLDNVGCLQKRERHALVYPTIKDQAVTLRPLGAPNERFVIDHQADRVTHEVVG